MKIYRPGFPVLDTGEAPAVEVKPTAPPLPTVLEAIRLAQARHNSIPTPATQVLQHTRPGAQPHSINATHEVNK